LDLDPSLSLTSVLHSPYDVVEAGGRTGSISAFSKDHKTASFSFLPVMALILGN
jgi:hypothetical protein